MTKYFTMRLIVTVLSLTIAYVQSQATSEFILPRNVKPVSYVLKITTHLGGTFKFDGEVHIKISCIKTTDTIILHAKNLEIECKNNVVTPYLINMYIHASCDKKNDLLFIKTNSSFQSGVQYVLSIPFTGNLTENPIGYYRSSYVHTKTNQTKWLAVTQFEPEGARRAFPCFDEPDLKATFKIIISHRKNLTSVSNTRLKKTSLSSIRGYVVDEFVESLPMSTYLVAYMVSDLPHVKSNDNNDKTTFRISTRTDVIQKTKFAKNEGKIILEHYQDYFYEKFPYSKIDIVAIPEFPAVAKENWGLVIYEESELLINTEIATIDNVQHVTKVMAYTLAHQWFGSLVTMKWWTDGWLNEAVSTYFAARGVDYLHPEWNSFEVNILEEFLTVMDLDSLDSARPVSKIVERPDKITQKFDKISYKKGALLLHMLNKVLGETTFKQAVIDYIKQHGFSSVEPKDLWSALTTKAHQQGSLTKKFTVKQIIDSWTSQAGYPVLIVNWNSSFNKVIISQKRYLEKSNRTDTKSRWWIPVTLTTSTEADFDRTKPATWLVDESDQYILYINKDASNRNNKWIIFNVQMSGLYRILYDTQNWLGIISTLNDPKEFKKIHTLNRVQLISDAISFSQTGHLNYKITFQMLKYLRHETEYGPWYAALNGLSRIENLLENPDREYFTRYMNKLLKPLYRRFKNVSAEINDFKEIRLKNLVVSMACQYGYRYLINQVELLFTKWMVSSDPDNYTLPRELKTVIYCQQIKSSGLSQWNFLLERYERSNDDTEKSKMLSALGCSHWEPSLIKLLNMTRKNNYITSKQEAFTVFQSVARNRAGFKIAKDFLFNHTEDIYYNVHPRSEDLGKYIQVIGSQMKTQDELKEIRNFVKTIPYEILVDNLTINQISDIIQRNIDWSSDYYNSFIKNLKLNL